MNSWAKAVIAAGFWSVSACGQTIANRTVTFTEYAFPTTNNTTMSGSTGYNLFNDVTGASLTSNNGDFNDVSMTFANSGVVPLGTSGSPNLQWQTAGAGRFTSNRGYSGAVGVNLPGTRMWTALTMQFGSHMTVTDLAMQFGSLNTQGIAWEFSLVGFLRPDGTLFTPAPTIGSYLLHTALNGQVSQGWVAMDSTATVSGVGAALTLAGLSGSQDGNPFAIDYAAAGLAPGTEVGGFVWYSFLDDVRGIANGSTNFTASLNQFTFSGLIVAAVPEPGALLLAAFAGAFACFRRRAGILKFARR